MTIFKNATEQYRHNDSWSYVRSFGALFISAYPYLSGDTTRSGAEAATPLLVSGAFTAVLLASFFRFTTLALLARLVMRGLELALGQSGVSYNLDRFCGLDTSPLRSVRGSNIVVALSFGLAATNLAAALVMLL